MRQILSFLPVDNPGGDLTTAHFWTCLGSTPSTVTTADNREEILANALVSDCIKPPRSTRPITQENAEGYPQKYTKGLKSQCEKAVTPSETLTLYKFYSPEAWSRVGGEAGGSDSVRKQKPLKGLLPPRRRQAPNKGAAKR